MARDGTVFRARLPTFSYRIFGLQLCTLGGRPGATGKRAFLTMRRQLPYSAIRAAFDRIVDDIVADGKGRMP
jgi:hypothetical protein